MHERNAEKLNHCLSEISYTTTQLLSSSSGRVITNCYIIQTLNIIIIQINNITINNLIEFVSSILYWRLLWSYTQVFVNNSNSLSAFSYFLCNFLFSCLKTSKARRNYCSAACSRDALMSLCPLLFKNLQYLSASLEKVCYLRHHCGKNILYICQEKTMITKPLFPISERR